MLAHLRLKRKPLRWTPFRVVTVIVLRSYKVILFQYIFSYILNKFDRYLTFASAKVMYRFLISKFLANFLQKFFTFLD